MPDLRNELMPLVVYDDPRVGTTQLRNAESVDGSAGINLRADIDYPMTVAGGECPHGYRYGWLCLAASTSASAGATNTLAAETVPGGLLLFMAGLSSTHDSSSIRRTIAVRIGHLVVNGRSCRIFDGNAVAGEGPRR
jgi:hypothetical protein